MQHRLTFSFYSIIRACLFILVVAAYSQGVLADDTDDFIQRVSVSTYDCPDDEFIPKIDDYLRRNNVLPKQLIKIKVHKAQWLICVGRKDEAQTMLESLLSDPVLDKNSQSFASIYYQLGFIFDVQEKPERCDYYRKSEQLAKGKFADIYLSSQLGLITVCEQSNQDIGIRLGRLFNLLQSYSEHGDVKSIAHIHNSIGLLFSTIGQRALAAEQYEKAYQLGLNVYEEKNQLAPLISIITAYSGSGDYEKVELIIDELEQRNSKVNTPLSNSWLHFAKSRQAYRTNDYESMRKSLRSWNVFLKQISPQTMHILYEWYVAALCLHDKDRVCVDRFLQKQNDTSKAMPARLSKHLYYNGFLVEANLFVGNVEAAQQSFSNYTLISLEKSKKQQGSARVLGVANLHNQIIGLETSLEAAEERRLLTILMMLMIVVSLIALGYIIFGRRYLHKLTTDPITGLLNEHSALSKIKKVKAPVADNVNALALFDVINYTYLEEMYGYRAAEQALKHVANCIQQVTREKDIEGRICSDQFVICLVNIEETTAIELLEQVQKSLSEINFKIDKGKALTVDAKMHVYCSVTGLSDADEVISEVRSVLRKEFQSHVHT